MLADLFRDDNIDLTLAVLEYSHYSDKIHLAAIGFNALGSLHENTVRNFEFLQLTEVNVADCHNTKETPYAPKFWLKSVKFLLLYTVLLNKS